MYRLSQISKMPLEICAIRATSSVFTISQHGFSSKDIFSNQLANLPTNTNYVKDKFNDLVIWYEQVTGMDEVRMMQNRVIEAQNRFIGAQEKRRDVGKELARIQNKLKEIHSELDTTSRGEERYLQLITEEHSILKDERRLVTEFALLEREERDSFNMLSSCVKESHEKERAQADRTKYWSIIGSIIGTVIGVAGSSINNEFKMRELRKLVRETAVRYTTNPITPAALAEHEHVLTRIVSDMKTIIDQQANNSSTVDVITSKKNDELIGKLDKTLNSLQHAKSLASLSSQVEEMKDMLQGAQRYEGQLVTIPQDLETKIVQTQREIRFVIVAVTIMGIVVTLLSRT